ncbi:hypothetical protein BT69DRAFT_201511 [Atractiella rhizophila]|nr:hypothetical protein BT69DRAFT_201511 [Atractiella rhizophila]
MDQLLGHNQVLEKPVPSTSRRSSDLLGPSHSQLKAPPGFLLPKSPIPESYECEMGVSRSQGPSARTIQCNADAGLVFALLLSGRFAGEATGRGSDFVQLVDFIVRVGTDEEPFFKLVPPVQIGSSDEDFWARREMMLMHNAPIEDVRAALRVGGERRGSDLLLDQGVSMTRRGGVRVAEGVYEMSRSGNVMEGRGGAELDCQSNLLLEKLQQRNNNLPLSLPVTTRLGYPSKCNSNSKRRSKLFCGRRPLPLAVVCLSPCPAGKHSLLSFRKETHGWDLEDWSR